MIIANNATYKSFVTNYGFQNDKLQTSMYRLSSGSRMVTPGEAPADLGISERFRAQIRNTEAAGRVIQNALNMMQTADSWLQEVNNILNRVSELAVSAADGSKNQDDRKNLDLEFQQLKSEVARISEAGRYNGLAINTKTAVSVYDYKNHELVFHQSDGSDQRNLGINFQDGNAAANGVQYAFESSAAGGYVGDFLFTDDGKNLIYMAQKTTGTLSARKTLMKLDVEANSITSVALTSAGGESATTQARIVMDEKGRVWVSDPSTATNSAVKNFNVKLLDVDDMTLDAGGTGATNEWAGSVSLASSFSEFAVHQDYLYYIERSGGSGALRLIKRSIYDTNNKETLLSDLSGSTYDFDAGETYAISSDGQYLAYEDEDNSNAGTLVVVNTSTGDKTSLSVGTRTNSIAALEFDGNNNLYWTDTGGTADENALKRLRIKWGDQPILENVETIRTGNAGSFGVWNSAQAAKSMGLSIGGGTPAARYEFHIGADESSSVDFVSADVRLTKLGLSKLDVMSVNKAQTAITAIANAVDIVTNQRAIIGSQASRMNFTYQGNMGYLSNVSQAESRIRDVDIASETAKMTGAQILAQTGISILAQANTSRQNLLRLLQ